MIKFRRRKKEKVTNEPGRSSEVCPDKKRAFTPVGKMGTMLQSNRNKKQNMFDKQDLANQRAQSLQIKIQVTQAKLIEWYIKWKGCGYGVYLSFSGGKDSTVLADLTARVCRMFHYGLTLVFVDTGLEYPEIKEFIPSFTQWLRDTYRMDVELVVLHPEMTFDKVLIQFGYPVISKNVANAIEGARKGQESRIARLNGLLIKDGKKSKFNCEKYGYLIPAPFRISEKCCGIMKKDPIKKYEEKSRMYGITAEMAEESMLRENNWFQYGCNGFDRKRPRSTPMAFWTNQDVLLYLASFKIPFCNVYGKIVPADPQLSFCQEDKPQELVTTGCSRTGCMYCMFGITRDKTPNRFQRMKQTHPRQYDYCINGGHVEDGLLIPDQNGLGIGKVLDYIGEPY